MNKLKQLLTKFILSDGFKSFISSIICVILGLLFGYIIIVIVNAKHSSEAITNILLGGFNAPRIGKGIGSVITNAIPLLLCSLSIIFAYKCGLFNIGAPGQYVFGLMFAYLGAYILKAPWYVCIILSIIGGALWGVIPGLFKAFLNVNEVITSIMFNWIGLYFVNYMLGSEGPFADKIFNMNLNESYPLPEKAKLPLLGLDKLFQNYKYVTIALFISIIVAIIIQIILTKTKFGYEIKATGLNKDASKYAGMNYKKNIILTMAIAGSLAGLAASCFYLTGYELYSASKQVDLPTMGFNGIAVAFLGSLNPIGSIFSALLVSHIRIGGSYLDTTFYSSQIGDLISAIIIYLCALSYFIKFLIKKIELKHKLRKEKELNNLNKEVGEDKC